MEGFCTGAVVSTVTGGASCRGASDSCFVVWLWAGQMVFWDLFPTWICLDPRYSKQISLIMTALGLTGT